MGHPVYLITKNFFYSGSLLKGVLGIVFVL